MRITFKLNDTIQVFRLGKTANKKISKGNEKIVQTYTFSTDQFEYVLNNENCDFKTFFSLDAKNCFDCPFSANSGNGKCYTHKFMQYSGFVSMLRSIANEFGSLDAIPVLTGNIEQSIIEMCDGLYVRFGTYGEPTLHPINLVRDITNVSKNWTGYTHQYFKQPKFNLFFMASTHNELQAKIAKEKFGFRSFIATDNNNVQAVKCPASKESGFKSNCADCGLCSGVIGKGKKDIVILEH